jgi:hypothetical protein
MVRGPLAQRLCLATAFGARLARAEWIAPLRVWCLATSGAELGGDSLWNPGGTRHLGPPRREGCHPPGAQAQRPFPSLGPVLLRLPDFGARPEPAR